MLLATSAEEKKRILKKATRFLTMHYPESPQATFRKLGIWTDPSTEVDYYGNGNLMESFEAELATLVGKEAAVFMPSGIMANMAAMHVHCDDRSNSTIAFHPLSHIEVHEEQAYSKLHGLNGVKIGEPHRVTTLEDLQGAGTNIGAVLLELPQREIGGQLPSLEQLEAMSAYAKDNNIALHCDGARLWESKAFYRMEYSEICALFDSVYVSFYKTLGGIAGAALMGDADFITKTRVWQRRSGGTLYRLFPYVMSAKHAMQSRLHKVDNYVTKAIEIANVLSEFEQISITPEVPHCNMMKVNISGDAEALESAALRVTDETGVVLFKGLQMKEGDSQPSFELPVGDATMDLSNEEIKGLFTSLFKHLHEH